MRLLKLQLENFRGFAAATLALEADLTLIVGINGAGKTSLLRAAALCCAQLEVGIRTSRMDRRMADHEVRQGAGFAKVEATAEIRGGGPTTWSVAYNLPGRTRMVSDSKELKAIVDAIHERIELGNDVRVPGAVFYSVHRAVLDVPLRIKKRHAFLPALAYQGALGGTGADFRAFFEWFREREDLENEQSARKKSVARDPELEAVRTAITRLMPEFSSPRVERSPLRMVVDKKGGGTLSIAQLSDGEQCMLAMAGDLARRLVQANPTSKSPLDEAAVVLLDEVELHLHPGMQREVLTRLRQTFTKCQVVATTHSPQVVASVDSRCVRLLDGFAIHAPGSSTLGRDSNALLTEIFGTPERPRDIVEKLKKISKAIDQDDLVRAKKQIDQLAGKLSEDDAEIIRLRTVMAFLETPVHAQDRKRA